jgi:hypothetical protein
VIRNREMLLPGLALSVVVLGATLTLEPGLRSFTRALTALLLFFWTVGVALLTVQIEYRWHDVFLHRGPRRDTLYHAAAISVFAIPFFAAELVGLGLIIWLGSYSYGVILLGIALLNAHFHYLFKAPASAGRGLLDQIEGFEVALAAVEPEGRRSLEQEPTPADFEKFLPYAIALDCEAQWVRQSAAEQNSTFGRAIGDALCAAIASAATPPALKVQSSS